MEHSGYHRVAAESRTLGSYFGRWYHKKVILGATPPLLKITGATYSGNLITVTYDQAGFVPPIRFLTTSVVAQQTTQGFGYTDSTSSATITSVATTGTSIVLTMSATPTGSSKTVTYAMNGNRKGNVVDSDPSLGAYGESLPNWAPIQSVSVTQRNVTTRSFDPPTDDTGYASFPIV